MKWEPDTDISRYKLNFCEDYLRAKRGLLSDKNSLSDPLGLIPSALSGSNKREKMKNINESRISCLVRVSERTILFGISDSSQISYRAVLDYWEHSYPEPMLVNAKTKIVLKEAKRVPQIELKAAALLLKLAEIVIDTISIKERQRLFSDLLIA
jgi:Pao retrotransposon peptidase